jgi:hypothetical protein
MSPLFFQRHQFDQWDHERLTDEAFARYLDWRAESEAVDAAYALWSRAPRAGGALPFAAYGAALEREERAATVYRSVVDRIDQLTARGRQALHGGSRAARA